MTSFSAESKSIGLKWDKHVLHKSGELVTHTILPITLILALKGNKRKIGHNSLICINHKVKNFSNIKLTVGAFEKTQAWNAL